jgi:hypothetical protein
LPSCGPRHQAHARLLHRLETAQLPLQRVGHLLARQLLAGRRLGQQQPRLQIGKPRRHHDVVGGEFQPHPPRLRDMRQILIDQRHHRDAAQIDLLVAREGQQQVERAFEALEVDDQLALARRDHIGPLRRKRVGAETVGGRRRGRIAHAVPV